MNLFVADPHWGWWIIFYFFLGGIAAGAYFMATLIDLVGRGAHRELSRIGYGIGFPLVLLCGVVLIVDLDRPDRFWHMLFKSEVVAEAFEQGKPGLVFGSLMFKYWSPMSVGSWALLLFGLCSSFSLLGSLWPDGRLSRLLGRGVSGRGLQLTGCLVGFFVASYTGALVTATNQPLWSDSVLIAPLFLTSAASTGIALMILLAQGRTTPAESLHRLERADTWALGFELFVFAAFLVSLGSLLGPVWSTRHGKLLLAGVPVVGLLMPLAIRASHVLFGRESPGRLGALSAAALALVGGFVLRYALLTTPPELLADRARQPTVSGAPAVGTPAGFGSFGPEDGRERGGGPGADPENRRDGQRPPSKVFQQPGADAP